MEAAEKAARRRKRVRNGFAPNNPHRATLMWLAYHGDEKATLREIGELAGLSAGRVREILQKVDGKINRAADRWLRSKTPRGMFPRFIPWP